MRFAANPFLMPSTGKYTIEKEKLLPPSLACHTIVEKNKNWRKENKYSQLLYFCILFLHTRALCALVCYRLSDMFCVPRITAKSLTGIRGVFPEKYGSSRVQTLVILYTLSFLLTSFCYLGIKRYDMCEKRVNILFVAWIVFSKVSLFWWFSFSRQEVERRFGEIHEPHWVTLESSL